MLKHRKDQVSTSSIDDKKQRIYKTPCHLHKKDIAKKKIAKISKKT